MRIHLPNSAWLGNIDPFLRSIDLSEPHKLHVSAHKKWISVHPVVIAMIAALAQTVPNTHVTCDPFTARSSHYFQRMRLFDFLGIDSGITIEEHEPAGRFVPITQITNSEEQTRFITEIVPMLHLQPEYAEPIRYIVSELLRNVIEHAGSPHGAFVAAQYYPKSNSIRIGIVDTGIGIKTSLQRSHRVNTDLDAIRLALMPGITGTTAREGGTSENAGAGLFFIKSIASINQDFLAIYSGSGFYKLLKQTSNRLHADPFNDNHSSNDDLPGWPGTVVGIDMTLDEHERFSTLLDRIRSTYGKAVRDRKRARYKKPRFI